MAKDIERVSINKFEQALNKDNIITETLVDTEDVTIQIKKTITLPEMMLFVQEVTISEYMQPLRDTKPLTLNQN